MPKNAPWLILLLATFVQAKYDRVDTKGVPVARVITTLTKVSAKAPKDWRTWLNLGRAHAMAAFLANDAAEVTTRQGGGPGAAELELWFGHDEAVVPFASYSDKKLRSGAHLKAALDAYQKAEALNPQNPVVLTGMGFLLQQAKRPAEAIEKYRTALKLAWGREKDQTEVWGLPISAEIISYLKPLLDPERDAAELAELEKSLATLSRISRLATPIAIPLEAQLSPADVQRPSPVWFDADGSGFRRSWTWLQPNAGWLAFTASGRVDSALQLFGSVTFWMFWRNGYEALSSLDDDGDGAIAGAELSGLSVWRDVNSNGVSEAGELTPVESLGIVSLSCRGEASREPGVLAASARGVTFTDGSTRPTWDLVLRQVDAVAQRVGGE